MLIPKTANVRIVSQSSSHCRGSKTSDAEGIRRRSHESAKAPRSAVLRPAIEAVTTEPRRFCDARGVKRRASTIRNTNGAAAKKRARLAIWNQLTAGLLKLAAKEPFDPFGRAIPSRRNPVRLAPRWMAPEQYRHHCWLQRNYQDHWRCCRSKIELRRYPIL
jgi:hypothetical protein